MRIPVLLKEDFRAQTLKAFLSFFFFFKAFLGLSLTCLSSTSVTVCSPPPSSLPEFWPHGPVAFMIEKRFINIL